MDLTGLFGRAVAVIGDGAPEQAGQVHGVAPS